MSSTRQVRRERERIANKLIELPPGPLQSVNLELRDHPAWMTRAYSNNRYVVMINDNAITSKGPAIRAMIQRHDDQPIPNHWREIQNIKNELFGPETVGIEYYPKESQLIDDHNIYWLWIFGDSVIPIPR